MTRNIFKDRESALEYEFFHKVDEQLLAKLKDKLDFEKLEHALADATGIRDETVLAELLELGITSETIFALSLFPLIWIAWADGQVAAKERNAILEAAHSIGHERDTASHHLIEEWLDHEPGDKIRTAWQDYVRAICETLGADAKWMLKQDVLHRSRTIAETAGGILGFGNVSDAQNAVLVEIAKAFGEE